MKIVKQPKVYLLSRPALDRKELEAFLVDHSVENWRTDALDSASTLVEVAGRICYMSFEKPRPGGNKAYIDHILDVRHGSVIEHAVWSFIVTGISRSLSHELVRHRVASYSQLSQRYVDESVAEYIEPDIIACDPELHAIWTEAVKASHEAYVKISDKLTERLLETVDMNATAKRKAARQAARSVLPNATETKITVTMNARGFRNFLEQRGSRHAEPEIRRLAFEFYKVLVYEAPALFGDYQQTHLPDGTVELTTKNIKV